MFLYATIYGCIFIYGSYMQQLHIYYKIIYKDYFKHIFQKITFGELV